MDVPYRIIHKARKFNLPGPNSFLADEPHPEFSDLLGRVPTDTKIGKPVLVFVRDSENWCFLAEAGIGGFTDAAFKEVAYHTITDVNGFPPEGAPLNKRELHSLSVSTRIETIEFEASPGEDLFSLWNLLRKISWPLRK